MRYYWYIKLWLIYTILRGLDSLGVRNGHNILPHPSMIYTYIMSTIINIYIYIHCIHSHVYVYTWLIRDMTCRSHAIKDRKFSGRPGMLPCSRGCWTIQPASTFMSWSRSKLLGRFEMPDVLDRYHDQQKFPWFISALNFGKSSQVIECLFL